LALEENGQQPIIAPIFVFEKFLVTILKEDWIVQFGNQRIT
jgi:hypothetical protein